MLKTIPIFIVILIIIGTGCTGNQPGQHSLKFTRVLSGPHVSDTASSPSASWNDIDSDGDDDLYVLNGYATLINPITPQVNELFENDGKGNFRKLSSHPLVNDVTFSGSSIWADYDNDGDDDVFVANQQDVNNYLFRNDGNGDFTRITSGDIVNDGGKSFSASWVDIDNDGWLDLYVANGWSTAEGQYDFMYRNLGDGTFVKVEDNIIVNSQQSSGGGTWGDFDKDGDQDVLIPVPTATFRLYRNEGNWNFTDVTEAVNLVQNIFYNPPPATAVRWIDYDNDLDLDLFVGNAQGRIDFLYENDGSGMFTLVTAGRIGLDATSVSDATWGDFDNDADVDLILGVWGGASEFYENNGNGEFYPINAGDFGIDVNFTSSVSINDADQDGDLDIYLTQWPVNETGGLPNQYYKNEITGGNWIKIKLEGTSSNRSGIGATIILHAQTGGKVIKQMRQVGSRTSWRSSGGLIQHFGLGNADLIQEIEVQWPSGIINKLSNIEVNKILTIKEATEI